jgi:hypothetical protein
LRRASATRAGSCAIVAKASPAVHQPQHALVAAVGDPALDTCDDGGPPARQVRYGQIGHPRRLRQPRQVHLQQARPAIADQQRLEDAVTAHRGEVIGVQEGRQRVVQFAVKRHHNRRLARHGQEA